jgi:hypothetical protein
MNDTPVRSIDHRSVSRLDLLERVVEERRARHVELAHDADDGRVAPIEHLDVERAVNGVLMSCRGLACRCRASMRAIAAASRPSLALRILPGRSAQKPPTSPIRRMPTKTMGSIDERAGDLVTGLAGLQASLLRVETKVERLTGLEAAIEERMEPVTCRRFRGSCQSRPMARSRGSRTPSLRAREADCPPES